MFVQITDGTREAREARRARSRTPSPRKPISSSRNDGESSSSEPGTPHATVSAETRNDRAATPVNDDDSLEMNPRRRHDDGEVIEIPFTEPAMQQPVDARDPGGDRSPQPDDERNEKESRSGRMKRFRKKLFARQESKEVSIYTIDREMAAERGDQPLPAPPSTARARTPPTNGRAFPDHTYPPYRLPFLPPDDWKDPDSPVDSAIRLILCQSTLVCFFFMWLLTGVLFFYFTEGPYEYLEEETFRQQEKSLVVSLATDLRLINSTESIWTATIEKYILLHRRALNEFERVNHGDQTEFWTFPGCILFSVSLLTTLGLATPLPDTLTGQLGAFFFTLFGLPLHVLILSNLARTLAVKIQIFSKEAENKFCDLRQRIINMRRYGEDIPRDKDIWPEKMFLDFYPPAWLGFTPFALLLVYYTAGLLLFGIARGSPFLQSCFFFLDFADSRPTAGAWSRLGYAWYLEGAAILAALSSVIWRDSPLVGLSTFGIGRDFLINSLE